MLSFAYDVEMLLVALTAIRHKKWASLHFHSVRGYVYTDKGRQIWPPSALSDSSRLWPRSSAAAGSCGIPLLGKRSSGRKLINNHLPSSMQFPSPLQLGHKSHCMGLSLNIWDYITWASQILLVNSEENLFSLENFPSSTSWSMCPLFLATLLTLKLLDQRPPFIYTFRQHVRTLGYTAVVVAKE